MRVALVAPPMLPIPPTKYGGIERMVGVLAEGLYARGHDVTLFAAGDSRASGRLVATVPAGLWESGYHPDPAPFFERTAQVVLERAHEFDLLHLHLEHFGFALATASPVPTLTTIHGRTDIDPLSGAISRNPLVPLVAISASQRDAAADGYWIATIHHGLALDEAPAGDGSGGYLAFVGRLSPDKGVAETVELARIAGRRLLIAAKAIEPHERQIYDDIVEPAIADGVAEYLGEVDDRQRNEIFRGAAATVMLSRWPEPFGLVAIESLATGTPLIASRAGALPEIVVDGMDGFVVDDVDAGARAVERVAGLDRIAIRQRALDRFSADRMVDDYVAVYESLLGGTNRPDVRSQEHPSRRV